MGTPSTSIAADAQRSGHGDRLRPVLPPRPGVRASPGVRLPRRSLCAGHCPNSGRSWVGTPPAWGTCGRAAPAVTGRAGPCGVRRAGLAGRVREPSQEIPSPRRLSLTMPGGGTRIGSGRCGAGPIGLGGPGWSAWPGSTSGRGGPSGCRGPHHHWDGRARPHDPQAGVRARHPDPRPAGHKRRQSTSGQHQRAMMKNWIMTAT